MPVYDVIGERDVESVRCSIDLDPQRSQIIIEPFPGELQIVIDNRQASIYERLAAGLGDEPMIYRGNP